MIAAQVTRYNPGGKACDTFPGAERVLRMRRQGADWVVVTTLELFPAVRGIVRTNF